MSYFQNLSNVFFAQDAAPIAAPANGGAPAGGIPMQLILMVGGFLVLMYFLMVFPQKKERDRWNKMTQGLKKNDRVLLHNGIIGIVHSVDREKMELVLKVDEENNTKMRFTLTAIARVLTTVE